MKARVHVMLKNGVLDPQGKAVQQGLSMLGFTAVNDVRVGRVIEIDLNAASAEQAEALATDMAQKMLANPVMETFRVEIAP
ncbi:MAG TPA: phosphoribosylformylglycinamidine synthase [Hyphomonadaceae bacterium]|jgi:phosphoribosylformylglycinamidine synthase, purS protein|nr:phosphoribosylformylglycinamidine synthase [Hyphomonadaceae bacterium]